MRQFITAVTLALFDMSKKPCPDVKIRQVAGPGQLSVGDLIVIIPKRKSRAIPATVKIVLHPGSYKEEVIFKKKKNKYFNTRMVVDGESWVDAVYLVSIIEATE